FSLSPPLSLLPLLSVHLFIRLPSLIPLISHVRGVGLMPPPLPTHTHTHTLRNARTHTHTVFLQIVFKADLLRLRFASPFGIKAAEEAEWGLFLFHVCPGTEGSHRATMTS